MAGMAYVEIETPDGSHRVTLERDRLRIGRLATNDLVLAFPQVSRQHAELRHVNGQWWIADLGSTNGLQLDTRRIHDHALRDGDRLVLAPGISIRFHDTRAAANGRERPASGPLWEDSRPRMRTPRGSRALAPAAPAPPAPSSWPPAPSADLVNSARLTASNGGSGSGSGSTPDGAAPFAPWSGGASRGSDHAPTVPIRPDESDVYGSIARRSSGNRSRGYPVPRGPLHSGAPVGGDDPYRREAAAGEAARATAGPAALLHVCQTCGQRTAADAASCQHCHNSIASECPNCRLTLLPILDRCPRCHTPNTHSVRQAHTRRAAF